MQINGKTMAAFSSVSMQLSIIGSSYVSRAVTARKLSVVKIETLFFLLKASITRPTYSDVAGLVTPSLNSCVVSSLL